MIFALEHAGVELSTTELLRLIDEDRLDVLMDFLMDLEDEILTEQEFVASLEDEIEFLEQQEDMEDAIVSMLVENGVIQGKIDDEALALDDESFMALLEGSLPPGMMNGSGGATSEDKKFRRWLRRLE